MRALIPAMALVFATIAPSATAAIPSSERDALIAIYDSTNGDQWQSNANWKGAPGTECTWDGVTCDTSGSAVTGLDLAWNNVKGTLPPQIRNLTNLEVLDLTSTELAGGFPGAILDLSKLRVLNAGEFYGTPFGGTFPAGVANLGGLEQLDLSGNDFSGTIPEALFRSPRLKVLSLWANQLTGTIPATMNLPLLEVLDLSYNQFSGVIPPAIVSSPHLRELRLGSNAFTGEIPAGITRLGALEQIELPDNQLSGSIPTDLGNLTALTRLVLDNNDLSGSIPPSIGQLQQLRDLGLSNLLLSGPVPPELFTLTKLENLGLTGRADSGTALGGSLADFMVFTSLRSLYIGSNAFTGPIPSQIGSLTKLADLHLEHNPIGGEIPAELGNITTLRDLSLQDDRLNGVVPASLGNLTQLLYLHLDENQLASFDANLGSLAELVVLEAADNQFTAFPVGLEGLAKLQYFDLSINRIQGEIPPAVFSMPEIVDLSLAGNRLTGSIPPLGEAAKLEELRLNENLLTGPIPGDIGQLRALRQLDLSKNGLDGEIPSSIGALSQLEYLALEGNRLSGAIPSEIANLTALRDGGLILDYNALSSSDPSVDAFLMEKAGDWAASQTVAPADAAIRAVKDRSVVVSWTPIRYQWNPGGYQIEVATSAGGPFSVLVTTPDKTTATFILDGLEPTTDYFVRVSTVTYSNRDNPNTLVSEPTAVLHARTTNGTPAPASVVVLSYPDGMYQEAGKGGAGDRFIVVNVGDLATTVTVSQEGDFFTLSPASFTLGGGASQEVDLTGLARDEGDYRGAAILAGEGVPAGTRIPVRLASVAPASGTVLAIANTNRIDVAATAADTDLSGSVVFTNSGSAKLTGIVVADQPWIVPPSGFVTIDPGASATVEFGVDRTLRPDAASLDGTAIGTLALVYASGTNAASMVTAYAHRTKDLTPQDGIPVSTSLVTVVDTVKPPTSSTSIPPLRPGEVPLFIAGVGHIEGSVGLFLSDLSLVNVYGSDAISDVAIYYTPTNGTIAQSGVTAAAPVQPGQALALADVVKNVFDGDGEQGTLQIRSLDWNSLALNANIINVSSSRGTYGTSIPVFRGDRAAGPGGMILLTGLRKDASSHTNILLQEVSGNDATADLTFYAADGTVVPSTAAATGVSVPAFRLSRLNGIVPDGAVLAAVTNRPDSAGSIVVYATPVDDRSGDTWSIADWNSYFASTRTEPQIIPVAGSLHGANNNFFRTDIAITNPGSDPASAILRYHYNGGAGDAEESISLTAHQTRVVQDVVGTLFPSLGGTVGFMTVTPTRGAALVTSRTFATQDGVDGTFGTGVPTLPGSFALHAGQKRIIAGLDVASVKTIGAKTPATFRTNLILVETSGAPATAKVTVIYAEVGHLATGTRLVSRSIELKPYDLQIMNVTSLIGEVNPGVGDLRNVQLEIRITGGAGAVIPMTSSVDNGTADQTLRIE
ncbi:MAG: fibronectin type III domain-containing protein [Thermoanaerobaculia bacterium]